MKAPKFERRRDGWVVRRRTNRANFVGWTVIAPDGTKHFSNLLKWEDALESVRRRVEEAKGLRRKTWRGMSTDEKLAELGRQKAELRTWLKNPKANVKERDQIREALQQVENEMLGLIEQKTREEV